MKNVAEVDQHVRGSLRPAGDVQASRDHVSVLPTSTKVLKVRLVPKDNSVLDPDALNHI